MLTVPTAAAVTAAALTLASSAFPSVALMVMNATMSGRNFEQFGAASETERTTSPRRYERSVPAALFVSQTTVIMVLFGDEGLTNAEQGTLSPMASPLEVVTMTPKGSGGAF